MQDEHLTRSLVATLKEKTYEPLTKVYNIIQIQLLQCQKITRVRKKIRENTFNKRNGRKQKILKVGVLWGVDPYNNKIELPEEKVAMILLNMKSNKVSFEEWAERIRSLSRMRENLILRNSSIQRAYFTPDGLCYRDAKPIGFYITIRVIKDQYIKKTIHN